MLKRLTFWFSLLLAVCLLSGLGISGGIAADEAAFQPKAAVEHGFEDGDYCGWVTRGGAGVVLVTKEAAHSGSSSLKMGNRTLDWHCARTELTAYLEKGAKYSVEVYVRLAAGEAPCNMYLNMLNRVGGKDTETNISGDIKVTAKEWTKLQGEYVYPPDITSVYVYLMVKDSVNASYLMDDFKITTIAPAPKVKAPVLDSFKYDFENDTGGWIPRGSGTRIAVVKDAFQSGSASLKTTNRTANWHGPSLNCIGILKKGAVYQISGYVKLAAVPSAPSTIKFTMENKPKGGSTGWTTVAQQSIGDDKWAKLSGGYSFDKDMDALLLYAESSVPGEEFYLDNVTITMTVPPPSENSPAVSPIQAGIPALKDIFDGYFAIGAAVEPDQLAGPTGDLLKKHCNSIVAENVMKPVSIQPQEGNFNWTGADRIFKFAEANKMTVRFHTLVWHSQVGEWFFRDAAGKDMSLETDPAKKEANKKLLLERLEKHITAIAERYKDKVDSWDVVNEVIDPSQPDGMRRSKWYLISGTDYIEAAFRTVRKVAGPKAKLFINDYNTEDPAKCEFLYKLVKEMLAKGVPIDGVGHQCHINVESPSVAAISKSIQRFAAMGLDNQITELDVSAYTNNSTVYSNPPQEIIVQQGYRYRELFAELRKLKDAISNVTFWGIADDHTWLHTFPITRRDAPLPFDEQYQAKPAYWGMVDPSKLPVMAQKLNCYKGTAVIDGIEELKWKVLSWNQLRQGNGMVASFKTSWDEKRLYLLARVEDSSVNRDDAVDIFIDGNNQKTATYQQDDNSYTLKRSGQASKNAIFKAKEIQGGYLLEASLPLPVGLGIGKQIGFDIRVNNVDLNKKAAWNDFSMSQDTDTSKYGTLILGAEMKITKAVKGTPKIDAVMDPAWTKANVITTSIQSQDAATGAAMIKGASAKVRTMWDEGYLYVFCEVTDPVLNKASSAPYEHDSVEFFIDENNGKTSIYEDDDAQYRVNFENLQTFGANGTQPKFKSAAKAVKGGYIVEAAIPFQKIKGQNGLVIGFDAQVNDANENGKRISVMTWNDPFGNNYRDTSSYGCLALVLK
ncbi:MAG: endo-1,4-beta-xylanase [Firmicutes bacterium]|nr:endo-1,4-beta-xylanase [Bacillota bacterium]